MKRRPATDYNMQIRTLAAECVKAAKKEGLRPGSYAFGSFLRGQFQVIASQRPHLHTHRFAFLDAAGVTK